MLKNLIFPLIFFFVVSLVSLYMTGFYIEHFGYEGVGVISNSNALAQSVFFVGSAFISVYGRDYICKSHSLDKENVMSDLTIILFIVMLASFIIGLVFIFIDNGNYGYYYAITFFSMGFVIFSQRHTLIPFSENKIYITSFFDCLRTLLRNGLCIVFIAFSFKGINANAIAMLIAAFFILLVMNKLFPIPIKITSGFSFLHSNNIKQAGWVCLNQGGSYLFSFADVFIINLLLGHSVGGVYAVLIQLPVLFKSVTTVVIGSISSYTIHLQKEKDISVKYVCHRIYKLVFVFSFCFSFLFIFLVFFKYDIFHLWLNITLNINDAKMFSLFCIVIMMVSISNLFFPFFTAWGIFSFPAKAISLFSVLSTIGIFCVHYLFPSVVTNVFVFCAIYSGILLYNVSCFLFFSKKIGINLFRILVIVIIPLLTILFNYIVFSICFYVFSSFYYRFLALFIVGIVLIIPVLFIFKRATTLTKSLII
ncbi:hypothetical protein [Edwardsiella tarda]